KIISHYILNSKFNTFVALFERPINIFWAMDLIKLVHQQLNPQPTFPVFKAGDSIVVSYKIVEGAKERIQDFKGDVLQIKGSGAGKTFTVRKISNGVGVERIFPYSSPHIVEIKVLKKGKVRRARLFYLRDLVGKKAKIREKKAFT
ncbi:MAG TPA: 50S ribosomal protein L19, partial [Saprospiraceae bacterium]|nr:50S ribosomal protein L19 [Saprospiraceae bacterium]